MDSDDHWRDIEIIQRWRCAQDASQGSDPKHGVQEAEMERSARRICNKYRPRLVNYFNKWNPQQSEDLAQETLFRTVVISICKVRPPLEAWLFTVARNLRIDAWTRGRRIQEHEQPLSDDDFRHQDALFDPQQVSELEIEELIDGMPPQRRQCVKLRRRGHSIKEIATLMKLATGTVQSHLHHAREDIRKWRRP